MTRYEEPGAARYRIVHTDRGDQFLIPARKNWFVIPFLCFWLCGWTFGGIMAMSTLYSAFSLFLVFWLGGWAVGWIFAASTLVWQLTGREIIAVVGSDIDAGWAMAGFSRSKLYRGSEIRNLAANALPVFPFGAMQFAYPPVYGRQMGSIKFSYGARTVYLGQGLDEAEGEAIVAELKRRLPLAATS